MIDRIQDPRLRAKRMDADAAAALIDPGMTVAMSGFTGAGYPKAVPSALASRVQGVHDRGENFRINVLTGASTAPELDGALARAAGIGLRLPYQSDPVLRERINAGEVDYIDLHLSHVAQHTWFGYFGPIVSEAPTGETAGALWDGFRTVASIPGFFEIKKTRDVQPQLT